MKFMQHRDPMPMQEEVGVLLEHELPQLKFPVLPIQSISDSVLTLGENSVSFRNLFLLPWIVGMFIVLFLQAHEIYTEWKAAERNKIEDLQYAVEKYGEDHYRTTTDPYVIDLLTVIKNGKLPFHIYMTEMRYSEKWYAFPDRTFETDILRTSIASVLIIFLGIWAVRMKRVAPLYFDREKKIIYTWRKGKVWAQRYESLSYHLNIQALIFMLRMINPEGKEKPLWWGRYSIQPTGNPFFNFKSLQINVLAAIVKFMELGGRSVWPHDWEGKKPFYFFEDRKPSDFDEQLSLILQKIDLEKKDCCVV